ncbi:helix-turn-helix domain-containing protein [Planctomicrobium sp. SH664]|uniref:helix-turn-helix domain-containing protein n=1 Tax=Planctomicrobium sp. SH664 TaxID=3448125 RepID=UPI003F5C5CB1
MKSKQTKKRLAAELIEGMQEFTEALESSSEISEQFNVRTIKLSLQPTHYSPQTARAARELLGASQAVFAEFLGVSVKTVQSWEQGVNPPSGMAARFLDEIRHNPTIWRKRLLQLAEPV